MAAVPVSWQSCTRRAGTSRWGALVDAAARHCCRCCQRRSDPPQNYLSTPSPCECSHPECHWGTGKHATPQQIITLPYVHSSNIYRHHISWIKLKKLYSGLFHIAAMTSWINIKINKFTAINDMVTGQQCRLCTYSDRLLVMFQTVRYKWLAKF